MHEKNTTFTEFKVQTFFLLIIYIILLLLSNFIINDLNTLALISLFSLFLSVVLLVKENYMFFSLPVLFTIFTYIFHVSQFVFNLISEDYDKWLDVFLLAGPDVSLSIVNYTINSIFFLTIGFLIVTRSSHCLIPKKGFSLSQCRFCGKVLILLFLLPRLYVDVTYLLLGYMRSDQAGLPGIILTLAEGFYIGVILLLIGYRHDKHLANRIFLFATIYIFISILSGKRQINLTYWIALFTIYYNYTASRKEINIKDKIITFCSAYLGLAFIATIGDTRNNEADFFMTFINNISWKMLAEQIGEFGGTGITLGLSMLYVPDVISYGYGTTYVNSFVTLMPNFGGILDNFVRNLDYVYLFPEVSKFALGGSYLGELYYNFGEYGVFICTLIGIIIGRISKSIESISNDNIYLSTIIAVLIISPTLLWVRGVFLYYIRSLIWLYIIIYFILYLSSKYCKNKNKTQLINYKY